jgi:DNA modification methylase
MSKTALAHAAHSQVAYAIKTGKLIRSDRCEQCGEQGAIEAAHEDYNKPLDVTWLCQPCHRKWDRANPKGGTVATETPKLTQLRNRIIEFKLVPVKDIIPHEQNWRTHPDSQQRAVEESLAARGIYEPLLTYLDIQGRPKLADGHLRQELINGRLGPEELVPIVVTDLTEQEAREVLLTHDPLAGLAGADKEKLDALMRQCQAAGEGTAKMLAQLAKQNKVDWGSIVGANPGIAAGLTPTSVVQDEAPEPPKIPTVMSGELWLLGEHRLLCGDATDDDDVAYLLGDRRPAALITDPPYGVSYTGKTAEELPVHNDGENELPALLHAALGKAFEVCLPGAVWYVAAPAGPQFLEFAKVLQELGVWRQTIVWAKQTLVMGHSDYHYQHECVFYGWKPGADHQRPPDRRQTTLWEIDRPTASREHPTMKPVALFAKAMANSTTVGTEVYDPFLGSGTSIIAAEQLGRRCYGLEIGPEYCDVIIQRWQNLTGKQAIREDGKTYDELRNQTPEPAAA